MFYKLLSYRAQPIIFFMFFVTYYMFTPLLVYCCAPDHFMLLLAKISIVAAIGLLFGYIVLSRLLYIKPVHLVNISTKKFISFIFFVFIIFLVLVITTSDNVPLFFALKNRDVYEIALSRAHFLKARVGMERLFVYANAVLTASFLPYIILVSFVREYSFSWYVIAIPYFYSFLLLEKAFFLKFVLPFISYCSTFIHRSYNKKYLLLAVISIPLVIFTNTVISGFGSSSSSSSWDAKLNRKVEELKCGSFYSAGYTVCANNGRFNFILWRMIAVPVFTARDSLALFEEKYKDNLFYGRTSTFISRLFHAQHVEFERETFNSEWGTDGSGTASANSVFIIEQFVNFGWLGVLLSSVLVGYMFAVLRRSTDIALASMSILLSMSLFIGGLIPTMLSSGYLALFGFLFFVKLDD